MALLTRSFDSTQHRRYFALYTKHQQEVDLLRTNAMEDSGKQYHYTRRCRADDLEIGAEAAYVNAYEAVKRWLLDICAECRERIACVDDEFYSACKAAVIPWCARCGLAFHIKCFDASQRPCATVCSFEDNLLPCVEKVPFEALPQHVWTCSHCHEREEALEQEEDSVMEDNVISVTEGATDLA
jgi:hypothetical protein